MIDLELVLAALFFFVGPFLWVLLSMRESFRSVPRFLRRNFNRMLILLTLIGSSYSAFAFYSNQSLSGIQLLCADSQVGDLTDAQGNPLQYSPVNVTLRVGLYNPSLEEINGTWIVVVNLVTNGTVLNRLASNSPVSFILPPQGRTILRITFNVVLLSTFLRGNTTVPVIDLSEKYTATGFSMVYVSRHLPIFPIPSLIQPSVTRLTTRNPGFALANSAPNQVNLKAVESLQTALSDIVLVLWLRQSNADRNIFGCGFYTG